jgi:cytochrome c553
MSADLEPGRSRRHKPYRLSRHAWLLIVLLVLVAVLLLCGRSASAQGNRIEETIASALALEPNAIEGEALYRKHCENCHGRKAYGDSKTVTPALAGQLTSYLVKQLADVAEGYRELPEMHRQIARTELSTLQAVRDVTTYLSALPPLSEPQVGDGRRLVLGARIYKSVCEDCHGVQGEGDEGGDVPALRGQHYSYLLRQARQLASGHRYGVDISVIDLLDALSLEQLTAVSDYVSRLPASADLESVADALAR